MMVYRASDSEIAFEGNSFALDLETAIAYTANPGFGGPTVYRFEICGDVLDLTEERQAWDVLGNLLSRSGEELRLAHGYIHHVFDHLGCACTEALRGAGYTWAQYLDTYPDSAVTLRYCGEDMLEGSEV